MNPNSEVEVELALLLPFCLYRRLIDCLGMQMQCGGIFAQVCATSFFGSLWGGDWRDSDNIDFFVCEEIGQRQIPLLNINRRKTTTID